MTDGERRFKVTPAMVLWSVLALIAVILVAQNSTDTTIQVLGWTIQAPLFVVIVLAMLAGWGLGLLGSQAWSWRRKRVEGRDHD
jgi:uncharacterized integral membrane protein